MHINAFHKEGVDSFLSITNKNMSISYVTKETFDQMIEELNKLKSEGRSEIAKAIAEAREKGDLKENMMQPKKHKVIMRRKLLFSKTP